MGNVKNKMNITIAIPTFNRHDAINKLLKYYIGNDVHNHAQILVIDNNSPDSTYNKLIENFSYTLKSNHIHIKKNNENIGYTGNFIRLLRETPTEYAVICSDEDIVFHGDVLNLYAKKISQNNVFFCKPRAKMLIKNVGKLTGKDKFKTIKTNQIYPASGNVSGCTFHVSKSLDIIERYESIFTDERCIYSQRLLAIAHAVKHSSYWADDVLIGRGFSYKKSTFKHYQDETEKNIWGMYNQLPSRWVQYKLLLEFTKELKNNATTKQELNRIKQMESILRQESLRVVREAIERESGDILFHFDKACHKFISKRIKENSDGISDDVKN